MLLFQLYFFLLFFDCKTYGRLSILNIFIVTTNSYSPLSNITPSFDRMDETNILSSSAIIKFSPIINFPFDIQYSNILSNPTFYKNWIYSNKEFLNFLQNDIYWDKWAEYTRTTTRILNMSGLNENTLYRIRFQYKSYNDQSLWSNIIIFSTNRSPRSIKDDIVNLFIRGTGRNNHDNAIVSLNNNQILNSGLFQGLALIILNRSNLSVKEINFYNTNIPGKTENKTLQFLDYSHSTVKNITKSIIKENKYKQSQNLFKRISALNEDVLFILVSCYGWELYFIDELADLLVRNGAYNILEFKNKMNTISDNLTFLPNDIIPIHNLYHPYAFVGIPNIGPGNGYESIKSNKGHYLTVEGLPYAELNVRLKFNRITRNYQFDYEQYNKKVSFKDDYELLHKSYDYSLKNIFSFVYFSNITVNINRGFVIYDQITNSNIYNINATVNQTELDKVVLGKGNNAMRFDFFNNIFINGTNVTALDYYDYYFWAGIQGLDCPLPYNNITLKQCINPATYSNSDIPILKCKIGLNPQLCVNNNNYTNYFKGFN